MPGRSIQALKKICSDQPIENTTVLNRFITLSRSILLYRYFICKLCSSLQKQLNIFSDSIAKNPVVYMDFSLFLLPWSGSGNTEVSCKYNSPKQLDNVALDIKMFLEGILTLVVKCVALGFFHFRQVWLKRKQWDGKQESLRYCVFPSYLSLHCAYLFLAG